MKMAPVLITTRGTTDATIVKDATFSKLRDIIGCTTAEYVYLPDGMAFLCDEDGLGADKPVNELASFIAQQMIVGDVMLVVLDEMDEIPYE
jgi:hypothetical protein